MILCHLSLCLIASRVNDPAFLRDSVDFSDLLEDSAEREEDRKKKYVYLCEDEKTSLLTALTYMYTQVHEHSAPDLPLSPPRSKQLDEVLQQGTPFTLWEEPTIIAWLEVWVGMPYWYIAAIRACLQNGAMLEVSVCVHLPERWQA